MIADTLQLLGVTLSLIGVYVLPFFPIGRFLIPGGSFSVVVSTALVISTSTQAILGMLWSHIAGSFPRGEAVVFVLVWLMLLFGSWRISRRRVIRTGDRSGSKSKAEDRELGEGPGGARGVLSRSARLFASIQSGRQKAVLPGLPLLLVLTAAFIVRAVHPLQAAYLGQSDAYTHLHYIHNILDAGKLINPVYPPGYHWIQALPIMLFSTDPYLVARFGGAFFGLGLVLGLYALLEQMAGTRAALLGSFCAACFPATVLLQKTGVGVFANQYGIMLLPVLFLYYWRFVSEPERPYRDGGVFALMMAGLAASVPMMEFHVIIILVLDRFIALCRREKRWLKRTGALAVLIVPAFLLLAVHLGRAGREARGETARILVEYGSGPAEESRQPAAHLPPAPSGPWHTLAGLVSDFTKVKRPQGFGHLLFNGAAFMLIALFSITGGAGLWRRNKGLLLIGLWGTVTTIQTMFGTLQFSAYQREGWSMLVAVSALAGLLGGRIYTAMASFQGAKAAVGFAMVCSFLWMMVRPPAHPPSKLAEEDRLIRALRAMGASGAQRAGIINGDQPLAAFLGALDPKEPLTVVTRRFASWKIQDEIAPNILPRTSRIKVDIVSPEKKAVRPAASEKIVVFIGHARPGAGPAGTGTASILTPNLVDMHARQVQRLQEVNAWLAQWVKQLEAEGRDRQMVVLAPGLSVHILSPHPSSP